jgi:uncharacterized protein (DUF305 family)
MLHQQIRMVVLSGAVVMSGAAWAQGNASAPAGGSSGSHGHGSGRMHESMMGHMQQLQSMQSTGDADRDFATMMRMHHQGAIEMAKAQLQNGKSPELKAMARKIINDQQREIAQFDKWLAAHKQK